MRTHSHCARPRWPAARAQAEVTDDGFCRVGWSSLAASYNLGMDKHGFGYGSTGNKSHARQFDAYGEPYAKGDVVGCLLDARAGTLAFSRNGQLFPPAFELPAILRGQVRAARTCRTCTRAAALVAGLHAACCLAGPAAPAPAPCTLRQPNLLCYTAHCNERRCCTRPSA